MKKNEQASGVVRCQRCLKYGHYTYECTNQVAYRYRPSRTVLYKQNIKLALNNDLRYHLCYKETFSDKEISIQLFI